MSKKWAVKRLTVNLTSSEVEKLENYCALTGRPATDVIRELIRSLLADSKEASDVANNNQEKNATVAA
ncbi:ribbon-helix-helix protein, CopG family [Nostoc sp. CENA67]|uniref:Ribbon-helix-helix protein, CopG family n=1 Tax=Amazonocrinis nigriterrae CENA67 TaxID=2794033 RepID=A0A8J7LBP9_9NOST|nr:ribbon-helix-helix protein, CopG family [Amazonocrinis nigriterrae]MBH8566993.1 ribbon-helix-helix protein, CopG family [Amazonocrinis nigriterrae CENA67]